LRRETEEQVSRFQSFMVSRSGNIRQSGQEDAFEMTFEEFQQSMSAEVPPAELDSALAGLWWDAKGDWNKAHESAQEDEGPAGSWVHAYLHRKEGDASNAGYWYRRARRSPSRATLREEWMEIARTLLAA
jgi:hypothetical protein